MVFWYLIAIMRKILNISDAAAIAIHAMAYLSTSKRPSSSIRDIAGALTVSEHHLSKVMQKLKKAGLVESYKGPCGGFAFKLDPSEVSFLDILEAIDGPFHEFGSCLFSRKAVCGPSCLMGCFLEKFTTEAREFLSSKKLPEKHAATPF